MGEEVRLERLEAINEQDAVVVFPKSVAPELVKKFVTVRTSECAQICDSSSPAHLGLVFECFHDGLRILQHGDTVEINAVRGNSV